ncbi:Uncharacterised protein [Mycobacteroides abscessus subsp. abscessus]|nr:Uncharacterised protein [Mycobacteroides abscessus subsp. abscessus]
MVRVKLNRVWNILLHQNLWQLLHLALKLSVILRQVKRFLLMMLVSYLASNVPLNLNIAHVFLNMCTLPVPMRPLMAFLCIKPV